VTETILDGLTLDELADLEPANGVYCGSTSPEAERALFEKYPLPWSALLTAKADLLRQLVDEVTEAQKAFSDDSSLQNSLQLQKKMQVMRRLILSLDSDLLDLYASVVGQQAAVEEKRVIETRREREKVYA